MSGTISSYIYISIPPTSPVNYGNLNLYPIITKSRYVYIKLKQLPKVGEYCNEIITKSEKILMKHKIIYFPSDKNESNDYFEG